MHTQTRYQLWAMTAKKKWKMRGFFTEAGLARRAGDCLPASKDGFAYGRQQYTPPPFEVVQVDVVIFGACTAPDVILPNADEPGPYTPEQIKALRGLATRAANKAVPENPKPAE